MLITGIFNEKVGDHPTPSKLHERLSLCNQHLGNTEASISNLEDAILAIVTEEGENSLKICELKSKMEDFRNRIGENGKTPGVGVEDLNPLPEFHPNPHYPGLSDAVNIVYAKERGRFGVASRDIGVIIRSLNHQKNSITKSFSFFRLVKQSL